MSPAATVIVLAKRPEPGRVKTRLCPPLSADQAADVAAAALSDTLAVVDRSAAAARRLCFDGDPTGWLRTGWEHHPQCAGGLDERIAAAFAGLDGPAVLVGMDTPQLRPHQLAAFDPDRFDACIGLTPDGGYWAIGFRAPDVAESAVRGVPMSTVHTGREQLQRLHALGLSVQLLDEVCDVDTFADALFVAAQVPATGFAAAVALARTPECLMRPGALAAYEQSLSSGLPLHLRHADGRLVRLDVERWLAPADSADLDVVHRCLSPVLDVGCGPGRIVAALAENGHFALGIDIAATAVRLTKARGHNAVRADLFSRLPGEGRWRTVLLLDGNIGIGGDLDALLRRASGLLAQDGSMIVETHADDDMDESHTVRFVLSGAATGPEFAWRYVGVRALRGAASRCDLDAHAQWSADGRTFVLLRRR